VWDGKLDDFDPPQRNDDQDFLVIGLDQQGGRDRSASRKGAEAAAVVFDFDNRLATKTGQHEIATEAATLGAGPRYPHRDDSMLCEQRTSARSSRSPFWRGLRPPAISRHPQGSG
jgi:hypothetical protein